MSSLKDKPLNVGDEFRRYEKMDVAWYLACLCVFLSALRMRQAGARRQVCLGV